MIELFTIGPARVLNLNRGSLTVGAPADITIFDTEHAWTYDVNKSASKSRNSPFHGRSFRGGPAATLVNGRGVWDGSPRQSNLKNLPPTGHEEFLKNAFTYVYAG